MKPSRAALWKRPSINPNAATRPPLDLERQRKFRGPNAETRTRGNPWESEPKNKRTHLPCPRVNKGRPTARPPHNGPTFRK